jgi:hypothetical protein
MQKQMRARSAGSGTRLNSRRLRGSKAQAFNRKTPTRARDIAVAKFLRPMMPKRRVNGRPDLTAMLFDPDPIMEYPVAAQVTTDHKVMGWNIDPLANRQGIHRKILPRANARGERSTITRIRRAPNAGGG